MRGAIVGFEERQYLFPQGCVASALALQKRTTIRGR
jgi:hypothetical protein